MIARRQRRQKTARAGLRALRLGCLLLAFCAGCGRVEQAEQCAELAATVNPALDAIEQRRHASGDQRMALQRIGARYEKLAEELAQLRFSSPKLSKLAGEYATVFRRAGQITRAYSVALSRNNTQQLVRLRGELRGLEQRQQTLSQRIDQHCLHGKP